MGGVQGIEMWYPNTIVNDVKKGMWADLTKVIGDDMMFHLLCESSLFVKHDQGNYVQMTGFPISSIHPTDPKKRKRIGEEKIIQKKRRTLQDPKPGDRFNESATLNAREIDCPLYEIISY